MTMTAGIWRLLLRHCKQNGTHHNNTTHATNIIDICLLLGRMSCYFIRMS